MIGTVGAKPTRKKRGPVTGKTLEKTVSTSGMIVIDTDGDGNVVLGGKTRMYSGRVGALIRDRVSMLWSDWGEVPQEVKDIVHNATVSLQNASIILCIILLIYRKTKLING